MQQDNYVNGSIYHMFHFKNLESILSTRAILSNNKVGIAKIQNHSIANEDVQNLRNRIYMWDEVEKKYYSLHDYVPFYFAKRTPMLYLQFANGIQQDILFFEVSRSIINDPGVIFSDGNVTVQQLSQAGTESVAVWPITTNNPFCKRLYTSGNPHGTNANRSNVYSGSAFLEKLNWNGIMDNDWGGNPEKKRVKHAEVLIPHIVMLEKIRGISTSSLIKANEVNSLIRQYGFEGHLPRAFPQRDLYF